MITRLVRGSNDPNLFSPSQYAVRVHVLGGNSGSEHPNKIYSPNGGGGSAGSGWWTPPMLSTSTGCFVSGRPPIHLIMVPRGMWISEWRRRRSVFLRRSCNWNRTIMPDIDSHLFPDWIVGLFFQLVRLVFQNYGKVRVLSIDAGGSTDDILAAKTLLHLQTILRCKSGLPTAHIADFFDMRGVLTALLFTRSPDSGPMFTAESSLKFVVDNYRKLKQRGVFGNGEKMLKKVFGDLMLRDTVKAVMIPCYNLRTGAPFVFFQADALKMEGCDFRMAGVCRATVGERAMELKSTDGARKIVAVGSGVGISNSNPTVLPSPTSSTTSKNFSPCAKASRICWSSLLEMGNHPIPPPLLILLPKELQTWLIKQYPRPLKSREQATTFEFTEMEG